MFGYRTLTPAWLLALGVMGCSDSLGPMPDPPSLQGPPFLTAAVDGTAWEPDSVPGALTLFFGTHMIAITADRSLTQLGSWERLEFELETAIPPQPGSYALATGPQGFATLTTWTNGQITAGFTTTARYTGTLRIAQVSAADGLMTGAFRFQAVSYDGRTVRQVQGSFRLRFP